MKTEYVFDTLADLSSYFEMMADRNARSAEGALTKTRGQLLREAAHTWRSAANVVANATIKTIPQRGDSDRGEP